MAQTNTEMPNLFLIGASKSGSSSLHSYLSHHPEICGSKPKEPCFFVDQQTHDFLQSYFEDRADEFGALMGVDFENSWFSEKSDNKSQ